MGGPFESGIHIVSWRVVAPALSLCDRCRTSYGRDRYCDGCLRAADSDITEKRSILFPQAHDMADDLSAIA